MQSPQMIQAMQILQTPLLELKDQIEQELQENVFLELKDDPRENQERPEPLPALEEKMQREFSDQLDQLELRMGPGQRGLSGSSGGSSHDEEDRKQSALNNTAGHDMSLPEHLMSQARILDLDEDLLHLVEHVISSLDADAKLQDTAEQVAQQMLVPIPLAEKAIQIVRSLEPTGVAARDLRDRLLMQLDRLEYVRPLTRILVANYLEDVARNKLPKICQETGATIDEIKDSIEYLRHACDPNPASAFDQNTNSGVIPDVVVLENDGKYEVKSQRGSVPELSLSPRYREMLKEAKSDPQIYEYLRRKIEAAKWFIEAVHQRQSTIERIAGEVVRRQDGFLRHGVQQLKPMKMQDIADTVGVHISTVSRAISGKFIETPQGIFDMKRFFSGGTQNDDGAMVSQQAVKDTLKHIVEGEDKSNPLSDDQLVLELSKKGVHIARRTVTKYRKALHIDSSTRRRQF